MSPILISSIQSTWIGEASEKSRLYSFELICARERLRYKCDIIKAVPNLTLFSNSLECMRDRHEKGEHIEYSILLMGKMYFKLIVLAYIVC